MFQSNLILSDPDYWSQVYIAFAQVTFGIAWATIFLPFDAYKLIVITSNIIATIILVVIGAKIRRKK